LIGTLQRRSALIERVGIKRYNALFEEHVQQISTVAGHAIRPIVSARFGRIFMVGDTGTGFRTHTEAEAFARKHRENRTGPDDQAVRNRSRQTSVCLDDPARDFTRLDPTATAHTHRERWFAAPPARPNQDNGES
jgi:hypothetical protein